MSVAGTISPASATNVSSSKVASTRSIERDTDFTGSASSLGEMTGVGTVIVPCREALFADARSVSASLRRWIQAKAASLLRPGGHLAVWAAEHGMPDGFDPFFTEIQAVYNEIGEGHPGPWPPPGPDEVPDESAAFQESGHFDAVAVRRYVWAIDYDIDSYLNLLDTFSGHIAMEPAKRAHLYAEIRRRLATRPSGTVHRHWVAVMTVGRRR